MISARTDIHPGRTKGDAVGTPEISQREIVAAGQYIASQICGLLYEIAGENASFGSGLASRRAPHRAQELTVLLSVKAGRSSQWLVESTDHPKRSVPAWIPGT